MATAFVKNVFKIITGDLIVKIIGFLSIAIIARLYTPNDFGILELIVSIQLIALTFSSFKYEQAILLPKKDDDALNLLLLSLCILLLFVAFALLACFIIEQFAYRIEIVSQIGKLIYFIPLLILLRGFKDNVTFWFSRKKRFGRAALSDIINKLGEVSLKIFLSFIGIYGLFLGNAGGLLFSILVLAFFMWKMDKYSLPNFSMRVFKNNIIKYKKFPLFLLPSHFFKMMSERLPALVLSPFFGFEIVGFYALSFKLFNEPMSILGKSIGNVFYQEASKRYAENKSITSLAEQVIEKLFVLSFLPIGFLAIGGEILFIVFLGENWKEAGYYTQLLAPMMLFRFILTPVSYILNIIGKQHLDMIFSLILFISSLCSLLVGSINKNISVTLLLFSIVNSVLFFFLIVIIVRLVNLSSITLLRKIIPHFLLAIPFLLAFYLIKWIAMARYIYILACMLIGIIYYSLTLLYYQRKGEAGFFRL